MSEIINIEIQADPSGADEALNQVNKSLKEGTEAAEALNHVLDGDLAGAFKSLGELTKTLGIELDLAFSPAEIIAFVQVIAEVAGKLSELIEQHRQMVQAIEGQGPAWEALKQSTENFSDNTKIKLLEVRERIDSITQGPLAVFKDKLALIDAQTLDQLKKQFKSLSDEATKAFAAMEEGWFKQVIFGTSGAQKGIKEVGDRFRLTMDDIKAAQQSGNLDAIAGIIDKQIKKTHELIETDNTWAGTDQTKSIIEANERLLTVLKDLKESYIQIKQVADADKGQVGAAEADRVAKEQATADALHDKFVARVYAERQAMADKAAAFEATEAQETIAVLSADEKQNQATIKATDEQLQVLDEGYKGEIEAAKQASEQKIQLITQDFERGKINQQQEIVLIAKAKQDELALELLIQQKRWALWDKDPKKAQEVQNQINKVVAQSQLVQTKAVTDSVKAQEQQYKQVFSQIGNAFKTNVLSMLEGTETITQGFQKMYQSLLSSLADYIAQKAEKKAEEWAISKLFHTKEVVAETTAKAGISMAAGISSVMSALPFPLNVSTAPAVAAAAGAQTMSLGLTGLAGFDIGTNFVPMDGLAYLHKGEKIIPANQQGPGYSGSGAGITVVVNHSVSAVDAASFQGHIRRHGNMIANEVTRALKRKGIK
ncbi:MAG TPA: hypothetical protein VGH51_05200 [Candidatus Angelobacter sp.]|jgi:hypothetical protein